MASFLDAQNAFDPGDDLVGGGVGGFVEIDDAIANVFVDGPAKGGVAAGDGGVVAGADVEFIVIFQE